MTAKANVLTNGCFIADTYYGSIGRIPRHITSNNRMRMIVAYNLFSEAVVRHGKGCSWPGPCEFTNRYHDPSPNQIHHEAGCGDAYQPLPDLTPPMLNRSVDLVWSGGSLPFPTIGSIWVCPYRVRPLPIITSAATGHTRTQTRMI